MDPTGAETGREAYMAVIEVEISRRNAYAGGQAFGEHGPYDRIDGILDFGVDPNDKANEGIVDLDLAPRDAEGRVRFRSDFTLLTPKDHQRGNRRLIVDIVNRGRRRVVGTFNRAPTPAEGSADVPPGDGFLFRHGYSVVSIGWQWDVYRSEALMGLEAPYALVNGRPVRGQTIFGSEST